jgi:hypothetical protein
MIHSLKDYEYLFKNKNDTIFMVEIDSMERQSAASIYSHAIFKCNEQNWVNMYITAKNQLIELMEHEPTDLACLYLSFFYVD